MSRPDHHHGIFNVPITGRVPLDTIADDEMSPTQKMDTTLANALTPDGPVIVIASSSKRTLSDGITATR